MLERLFWILLALVAYTYFGYAIVLYLMVSAKKIFGKKIPPPPQPDGLPDVCLFVTAYNEMDYIERKVANSFSLNYPKEKIQYLWITDGSNDGSPEKLKQYPQLEVYHQDERRGKMHAMNRGMKFVRPSIVIFSDSNTSLGENSVLEIVKAFQDKSVGCIAGEKRIAEHDTDNAAGAGENTYWKIESRIKKLDSELNTAIGAVGELFAIRKELFEDVEEDTLLDDFIISLRIARKGYKIKYLPEAYAIETASANMREELKRKIRIAAGGIQTIIRLRDLLNPFRYGLLCFQYVSHKVLRWTIAPIALFALPFINLFIITAKKESQLATFFLLFFALQLIMYLIALLGWILGQKRLHLKLLFVPYYFASMNYASVAGLIRFLRGKQSVRWEKAKRA